MHTLHRQGWTVRVWKIAADALANDGFILWMALAVDRVSADSFLPMVVLADLKTGHLVDRKPVIPAIGGLHVELLN
jgi:hypothetical protein